MLEEHALVLGGGGVAGIAWMTGLLAGLADAGQDVTGADLMIGTSAGSAVAAQVASGLSLDALFARQVDPALQARELPAQLDLDKVAADWAEFVAGATSFEEALRLVGAYALAADTVPEAERRAVIESRLPSHEWPSRRIMLVAVEAEPAAGELARVRSAGAISRPRCESPSTNRSRALRYRCRYPPPARAPPVTARGPSPAQLPRSARAAKGAGSRARGRACSRSPNPARSAVAAAP